VGHDLPRATAPLIFTATLGGALAFGDKKWLDKANDALVGLVVVTFLGLVALAAPKADAANLLRADFGAVVGAVPVMFVVRV
jgi:tyrosine-specific transport protein